MGEALYHRQRSAGLGRPGVDPFGGSILLLAPGTLPLYRPIQEIERGGEHYSKDGLAVLNQRHVDGELRPLLDELLGAIEGIHQPEAIPAASDLERRGISLLGYDGGVRVEPAQALH